MNPVRDNNPMVLTNMFIFQIKRRFLLKQADLRLSKDNLSLMG